MCPALNDCRHCASSHAACTAAQLPGTWRWWSKSAPIPVLQASQPGPESAAAIPAASHPGIGRHDWRLILLRPRAGLDVLDEDWRANYDCFDIWRKSTLMEVDLPESFRMDFSRQIGGEALLMRKSLLALA